MREVKVMMIEIGESIMDMVIAERRSREKADSNVHSWQREIGKGDCFKRIVDGLRYMVRCWMIMVLGNSGISGSVAVTHYPVQKERAVVCMWRQ
jgi:hypothetical protein